MKWTPRLRFPVWLTDPSILFRRVVIVCLSVTIAVLSTLALVSYVQSSKTARDALSSSDDRAERATARINALTEANNAQKAEIEENRQRIGALETQSKVLVEQLRRLRVDPIVVVTPATSPTTTTTTASSPKSTSPTTSPSTTPSTTVPPTTIPPTTTPPPAVPQVVPVSPPPMVCRIVGFLPLVC